MELNNELCKQIFHNLEETVILFSDKGGEYLKVIGSSQNCLGEEKCDLVGKKTIQETLSEDISNLFMTKINEAISEQEAIALEYQIANLSLVDMAESPNSSDVQYLRAKVLPVKENGRDMVAWISSDITEYKKKLEIQLENATRKTQ